MRREAVALNFRRRKQHGAHNSTMVQLHGGIEAWDRTETLRDWCRLCQPLSGEMKPPCSV